MCDVLITVINFNTRDLTLASLHSVYAQTSRGVFKVVVVDNASSDGSASEISNLFPTLELVASETNLGFAEANNLAARMAGGRYILLLNPDTVVKAGAIDKLVQFAENHPEYGIYGGRTLFPDGTLNPTSVWRRPTIWDSFCRAVGLSAVAKNSPLFSGDMYGGWRRDTVREVDIVSGCFLLIRRELWERLEGFDTSYFMYGEDWDLCLRARALGARCLFCPDAEIIHYGGASEPARADKLVRLLATRVKLYRRHWAGFSRWALENLLCLWVVRSAMVDGILGFFGSAVRKGSGREWSEVWARRREWRA